MEANIEYIQSLEPVLDTVVVQPADERVNVDDELAVNRGIAAAALEGVSEGVKVMEQAGIPSSVCLRVLNNKSRRRASDWK